MNFFGLDFAFAKNGLVILVCPDVQILEERYTKRNYQQQIKLDELKSSRDLFLSVVNVPHVLYKASDYEELGMLLEEVGGYVK